MFKKNKFKIFIGLILLTIFTFIYAQKKMRESVTCSPIRDELYCTKFICNTGTPLQTFGGNGACSDNSTPQALETWTQKI